MTFSPDSRRVAYVAQTSKFYAMVDGVNTGEWDVILSGIAFSPDGEHHAFTARDKAFRHFVVLDGKRREDFDDIGRFAFSPDVKKLAFGARKGRQLWWKVMDVK